MFTREKIFGINSENLGEKQSRDNIIAAILDNNRFLN
nr:MAG TPA: hypothetical protein [Bacteriophage sp.]